GELVDHARSFFAQRAETCVSGDADHAIRVASFDFLFAVGSLIAATRVDEASNGLFVREEISRGGGTENADSFTGDVGLRECATLQNRRADCAEISGCDDFGPKRHVGVDRAVLPEREIVTRAPPAVNRR